MQIKTIEKTIQSKMNEWLESIKDESLRNDVKNNLLVSGGSIVSLLLNLPVNDYDVYIKDMDVLRRLTEYYISPLNTIADSKHSILEITLLDGREKETLLNNLMSAYHVENEEEIYNSYSVSLKNLHEDQIKLFFKCSKGGLAVNEDKKSEDLKYDPVFFSPNAISLSNQLQIVIRFHGNSTQIHETFDFIHATNYFTFEEGLVTNKEALECIITHQLKYQGSRYPLTSIIRMKKFIKRGWNINAGEILKIMFQISELNLKDPNVLEEQLIGVDVAYFSKLIEILRGVPSENITSAYLNAIIDKIFNSADETNNEEQ